LSFKAGTDDMREATSLVTIDLLLKAGCEVSVYDPVSMDECKRRIGNSVSYCSYMYDVIADADALLVLTEWKQFRVPSWGEVKKLMKKAVIFDGRNLYSPAEVNKNGIEYFCIGR